MAKSVETFISLICMEYLPVDNTKLLLSLAYTFQHDPKVHENILRQTLLICDCVHDIIIFLTSKISIDILENIYKNHKSGQ